MNPHKLLGCMLASAVSGTVSALTAAPAAAQAVADPAAAVNTLIGTALVAGGTNAWNQIRERDVDARMARTRRRPLPSGRLTPRAAIWFASAITAGGRSA